jgi:putative effector of murein hydrolase LrgA (UPF0299 family)
LPGAWQDLLFALLVYPAFKYSGRLKARIAPVVSTRALLAFHVYAGVFAGIIGILHTGHKYQSPLGIALVVSMFVVIITGVIGRYYLPQTVAELRDEQTRLAVLRSTFDRAVANSEAIAEMPATADPRLQVVSMRQVVHGIAELEYSVGSRERIKRIFQLWIVAHVVATILLFLLLTLHVAGEMYYGLRWLS